ncbi:phage holin family protein [Paenibacillus sp. FSL R7-0337]
MDDKVHMVKAIAATAGATVGYLWGGWTVMLQALLVLVIVDFVTG